MTTPDPTQDPHQVNTASYCTNIVHIDVHGFLHNYSIFPHVELFIKSNVSFTVKAESLMLQQKHPGKWHSTKGKGTQLNFNYQPPHLGNYSLLPFCSILIPLQGLTPFWSITGSLKSKPTVRIYKSFFACLPAKQYHIHRANIL